MPRLDTLHINITRACNLGCLFCYARAVRGQTDQILSVDLLAAVAKDARELGARRVILSGGEPLAHRNWRNIARLFDDEDMEVSLATNGTLLTPSVVNFIQSLKRPTVSVSVDGDAAIHDSLRASPGAYARTLRGMDLLKDAGVPFDVNATVCRRNLGVISNLAKISRDFRCVTRLTLLHPNGRGEDLSGDALELEEIFRLREFCHILRHGAHLNIFVNLPPLLQYLDEIIPSRGSACGWAAAFCGILADGSVAVCGVADGTPELSAGNLHSQSLKEIWEESQLFARTRSLRTQDLKGICGRCPFREFCGGACRLSAFRIDGDLLAPYSLCRRAYDAGYIPEELLLVGGPAPECSYEFSGEV
ncbi:MAG TPA: radical SAM protein [Dehalococcoidia bacterium]|nr:radical SAM protein [Dehalococcoidia bacterium]